jgi:hypothetical protein
MFQSRHSVIPIETDHRGSGNLRSGEPALSEVEGDLLWLRHTGLCERPEEEAWSSFRHYATGCEGRVEIESEWTARKRERAAGKLCAAVELPHSSQKRA